MISKELLSLVLGKEVIEINLISTDKDLLITETRIIFSTKDEIPFLNADTLGRLCKEWITKQECTIETWQSNDVYDVEIQYHGDIIFGTGDVVSELEAIIKATEWVAKEKGLL